MKLKKDIYNVIIPRIVALYQFVTHIFLKERIESILKSFPIKTGITKELLTTLKT
jgi:hypothetical protein